jgi:hypothetical protein
MHFMGNVCLGGIPTSQFLSGTFKWQVQLLVDAILRQCDACRCMHAQSSGYVDMFARYICILASSWKVALEPFRSSQLVLLISVLPCFCILRVMASDMR